MVSRACRSWVSRRLGDVPQDADAAEDLARVFGERRVVAVEVDLTSGVSVGVGSVSRDRRRSGERVAEVAILAEILELRQHLERVLSQNLALSLSQDPLHRGIPVRQVEAAVEGHDPVDAPVREPAEERPLAAEAGFGPFRSVTSRETRRRSSWPSDVASPTETSTGKRVPSLRRWTPSTIQDVRSTPDLLHPVVPCRRRSERERDLDVVQRELEHVLPGVAEDAESPSG